MTTYQVPIADDGTGGVVAEIRLSGEPVQWAGLLMLIETLRRAETPMPITFAPVSPPPQFMSVNEAARCLGLTPIHIRRLIRAGHLTPIYTTEGEHSDRAPHVVPYDELVALATRARQDGNFPRVARIPDPFVKAKGYHQGANMAHRVLRAARKPMTVREIHEVISHERRTAGDEPITLSTVQKAVERGRKRGSIVTVAKRSGITPGINKMATYYKAMGKGEDDVNAS